MYKLKFLPATVEAPSRYTAQKNDASAALFAPSDEYLCLPISSINLNLFGTTNCPSWAAKMSVVEKDDSLCVCLTHWSTFLQIIHKADITGPEAAIKKSTLGRCFFHGVSHVGPEMLLTSTQSFRLAYLYFIVWIFPLYSFYIYLLNPGIFNPLTICNMSHENQYLLKHCQQVNSGILLFSFGIALTT